jgi:hypothetical protein
MEATLVADSRRKVNMQAFSKPSRLEPCPPHGPHLVLAVKESSYVSQCVACGLKGPECKGSVEARRALGEPVALG